MNDTIKRILIGSLLTVAVSVMALSLMWAVDVAFGYEYSLLHGLSGLPYLELVLGGAVAGVASTRFQLCWLRQRIHDQASPVYRTLMSGMYSFLLGFIYGIIAGGIAGAVYIIGQAMNPQATASSVELARYILLMGIVGAGVGGLIGGTANSLWQALRVPLMRFKTLSS